MKVAIVHDFLHQLGGAERVLEVVHEIFPQAPVYTLIYNRRKIPYRGWDIRESKRLKFLPFKKYYPLYLLFFPAAVEAFELDDYDLVFSISYGWSKGVRTEARHICYCLTPMRWAHEMFEEYVRGYPVVARAIIKKLINRVGNWDISTGQRPDYYLTTCENVAYKIKRYYGRDSKIIYPPVEVNFFRPGGNPGNYFLCASRLVPYKRIDLAVAAFNELGLPLMIIGTGPEERKLRKLARSNISFLGRVSDEALLKYYQECRALIFPGEEDFGIVPLEAQACGRPVIAYKKGGVLETLIDGRTGLFFEEQTPAALQKVVANFAEGLFNSEVIRENALRFSRDGFKKSLQEFINQYGQR
jgi:glycosyltransferase involved in cell wall biosynthesis